MVAETYLASTDHRVEAVDRGEAAVAAYTSSPGDFDLILMDIRMPGMDGYEAIRRIRYFEEKAVEPPVPILALSAHALEEEQRKSEEAGCDAHLTKPVKKGDLLRAIAEHARSLSGQGGESTGSSNSTEQEGATS